MIWLPLLITTTMTLLPVGPCHVTVYNPVKSQTDNSPLITADGTQIIREMIPYQRIAAVSQDMLMINGGPITYGDAIWVEVPDQELSGVWFVHDTMATEYYSKACDCMVPVEQFVDLLVSWYNRPSWDREPTFNVYLLKEAPHEQRLGGPVRIPIPQSSNRVGEDFSGKENGLRGQPSGRGTIP